MGFVQRLIGHLLLVVDARKWVCSIGEEEDNSLVDRFEQLQQELERERRNRGGGKGVSDAQPPPDPQQDDNNDWPPAPFMRNDDYGVCGWHGPKLTALEWLRVVVRAVSFVFLVSVFALCLVASTILLRSPQKANNLWSKWLPLWTKRGLKAIGFEPLTIRLVNQDNDGNIVEIIETNTTKTPFVETSAPVLVCNHVSYLDVPILYRVLFPSFIAKESVKQLPLWGRLAEVMQVTYVSHGSTSNVATATTTKPSETTAKSPTTPSLSSDDTAAAAAATAATTTTTDRLISQIRHNDKLRGTASQLPSIVIFPEGTTTNGSCLLPFKSGVFAAETKVQPILLEYHWNRFNVSWESIGLVRHIIYLLAQPSHRCTMTILNPIEPPTPDETNRMLTMEHPQKTSLFSNGTTTNGSDALMNDALRRRIVAKHFAKKTRKIMSKIGSMPCSDFTYNEKKKYHDELRSAGYS